VGSWKAVPPHRNRRAGSGLLVESFQEIFDYEYTARMETTRPIESGRERWQDAMHSFYERFSKRLANAEST